MSIVKSKHTEIVKSEEHIQMEKEYPITDVVDGVMDIVDDVLRQYYIYDDEPCLYTDDSYDEVRVEITMDSSDYGTIVNRIKDRMLEEFITTEVKHKEPIKLVGHHVAIDEEE